MTDPTDDEVEREAHKIFEVEKKPNQIWADIAQRRVEDTPTSLSEAERQVFRERARSKFKQRGGHYQRQRLKEQNA